MSDELPPDADELLKAGKRPVPEGDPIDLTPDNVTPIAAAKKKRGRAKSEKPKKERSPEDEVFLAGFAQAFVAGALIADIPAFEKAPIPPGLVLPVGYRLSQQGALWRDAGEHSRLIAEHVPLIRRILTDPLTREERLEIVFLRRRSWRSAIVERAIISVGGRDTARALGAVGAPITPRSAKDVAQWIADLERTNEDNLPCALVTTRSGWHELEDGELVFVLGSVALARHGLISDRLVFDDSATSGITRYVREGGEEDVQRRVVATLIAQSDAAAVMLAAAFAAPLLERVGAPSFAVHGVGPSTRGKTTTLTVAGGVYGCPEIRGGQSWVSTWDATSSGLEERAQGSSDLPLCLDEAGLVSAEQREQNVYKLVAGQGRTRAGRAGGLRASTSWRTVVQSTGEEPLVRSTARAGAQVRILQLRVDGIGELSGGEIAQLGADARRHYGWLGRQWIIRLLAVDDWTVLSERYRELEREFRALLGTASSIEQRQAEVIAALALASELVARWLGVEGLEAAVRRVAESAELRIEIVPEWKRGLARVVELLASEPGAFPRLELSTSGQKRSRGPVNGRTASKLLGYIDEDPRIEHTPAPRTALYLVPGLAQERLHESGLGAEVCAREWKRLGILIPWLHNGKERLQRRVTIDGTRQPVYALDMDAMDRALGGEDEPRDPEPQRPAQQELGGWHDPAEFQDP